MGVGSSNQDFHIPDKEPKSSDSDQDQPLTCQSQENQKISIKNNHCNKIVAKNDNCPKDLEKQTATEMNFEKINKESNVPGEFDVKIKLPNTAVLEEPEAVGNSTDEKVSQITDCERDLESGKQVLVNLFPITEEIIVPVNLHSLIIGRKGNNIHKYMDKYEVMVELPPPARNHDIIKISGMPANIATVKKAIFNHITDIDAQITIECVIPQMHHKTIMTSRRGVKVQGEFDVQINYPNRVKENDASLYFTNEGIRQCDIVRITGRKEKAEAAQQALIDLIPITEDINVPSDFYRLITRIKSSIARKFLSRYDVYIKTSLSETKRDFIRITGTPSKVAEAKEALCDQSKNFVTIDCVIPQTHHIIENTFNNTGEVVQECNNIHITGRQKNAEAAKKALIDMIPITEEINVAFDLHGPIKYQIDVCKFMDSYEVHIEFSPPGMRLDYIKITATPSRLAKAKKEIIDKVKCLEANRDMRSFEITLIDMDPINRSRIIYGEGIKEISNKLNVFISFPRKEDYSFVIKIQGNKAHAALKDILHIAYGTSTEMKKSTKLRKAEEEHTKMTFIHDYWPKRFYDCMSQNIQEIMEKYEVNIESPNPDEINVNSAQQAIAALNFRSGHNAHIKTSVPKRERNINRNTVTSSKVAKAIESRCEQSSDLVTIDCVISQTHYTTENTFNDTDKVVKRCYMFQITGSQENAKAAKQALIHLIPITEVINVAFELHRLIKGQNDTNVHEFMDRYEVHIEFSPPGMQLGNIKITGTPSILPKAKKALMDQVKCMEAYRDLPSFEIITGVDRPFRLRFITDRGLSINEISEKFNVFISFPYTEDNSSTIKIQGYKAHDALNEIIKLSYDPKNKEKSTKRRKGKAKQKKITYFDDFWSKRFFDYMNKHIQEIMEKYEVNIKSANRNEGHVNSALMDVFEFKEKELEQQE